jgi:general secretion pathway protein H
VSADSFDDQIIEMDGMRAKAQVRKTQLRKSDVGDAGFTLLEILVVFVIGALAVSAAVAYRGQKTVGLRVLAVQLASELNAAREAAIASDRPVGLVIDRAGTSYRAQSKTAGIVLPQAVRLAFVPEPGFSRGEAKDHLQFFADGSSTGGVYKLVDAAGAIALRVDVMSGAVAVEGARR